MNKIAVIRADGAPFMGIGHLMRCLTLAEALSKHGWRIIFISRPFDNHFCSVIENAGYELRYLPAPTIETKQAPDPDLKPPHSTWLGESWQNDAEQTIEILKDIEAIDLLIVDHYGLDANWQQKLRYRANKIIVIDDLADRELDCDILLDQTHGRNPDDYADLVPPKCRILTGTNYALIRQQFIEKRDECLKDRASRKGEIKRILVFLGGANIHNITEKVLNAFLTFTDKPFTLDIVLGKQALSIENVQQVVDQINKEQLHKAILTIGADDMASLIAKADLAIGAGGTSSWERCVLGLPTIMIEIAENQSLLAHELHKAEVVKNLGWHGDVKEQEIKKTISLLLEKPHMLINMGQKAAKLCDGNGSNRLIEELMKSANETKGNKNGK